MQGTKNMLKPFSPPPMSHRKKVQIAERLSRATTNQLRAIVTLLNRDEKQNIDEKNESELYFDLTGFSDKTLREMRRILSKPYAEPPSPLLSKSLGLSLNTSKRGRLSFNEEDPVAPSSPSILQRLSSFSDDITTFYQSLSPRVNGYGRRGRRQSSYTHMDDSQQLDSSAENLSPRAVQMSWGVVDLEDIGLAMEVQETWSCKNCTLENTLEKLKCEVCHDPRPFIPASGRKQPTQEAPFKITATLKVSDTKDQILGRDHLGGAFAEKEKLDLADAGMETVGSKKRKAKAVSSGGLAKRENKKKRKRAPKWEMGLHGKTSDSIEEKTVKSKTSLKMNKKQNKKAPKKKPASAKGQKAVPVRVEGKLPTKPGMKFVCGYCDKEFRYQTNWRAHERTHTGEKIFKCDWEGCGKRFAHLSSLHAHIAKHKGIKPFSCSLPGCGQKFANKSNLNRHMRRIHNLDTKGRKLSPK